MSWRLQRWWGRVDGWKWNGTMDLSQMSVQYIQIQFGALSVQAWAEMRMKHKKYEDTATCSLCEEAGRKVWEDYAWNAKQGEMRSYCAQCWFEFYQKKAEE